MPRHPSFLLKLSLFICLSLSLSFSLFISLSIYIYIILPLYRSLSLSLSIVLSLSLSLSFSLSLSLSLSDWCAHHRQRIWMWNSYVGGERDICLWLSRLLWKLKRGRKFFGHAQTTFILCLSMLLSMVCTHNFRAPGAPCKHKARPHSKRSSLSQLAWLLY